MSKDDDDDDNNPTAAAAAAAGGVVVLERCTPLYCGACGMPPEYCSYGPDYETHCNPWLKKHHPKLYIELGKSSTTATDATTTTTTATAKKKHRATEPWTMEQRLTAFYEQYEPEKMENVPQLLEKYAGKEDKLFLALVKKYGEEPEDPYYYDDEGDDDDDDDELEEGMEGMTVNAADGSSSSRDNKKKQRRGAAAKKAHKVDTRVVIQKITRNKKKATTVVVGMETVPGLKLKDVSKAFSKRFAGSSSVKEGPRGKEIILQGDHMDAVAEMCIQQFAVPKDSVYLDVDGEFILFSG